jgi:polar amino acid transport system substrate-binding protein
MMRAPQTGRLAAVVLASILLAGSAAGAASTDDRTIAKSALADIRSTIADIVAIENGFAVGHQNYIAAAERARNSLVGSKDREYVASVGTSGDAVGAIAHIDSLLDRKDDSVWTPAMQGAKINLLAAEQSLTDALHVKEMEDYETDLTTALSSLSLAIGRPADRGVLGGIQGALAATTLGVPFGASVVSGCSAPTTSPTYGVYNGNLMFVSVPRATSDVSIPSEIVVDRLSILPKEVILYTRPQGETSRLCAEASASPGTASPAASSGPLAPMAAHRRVAAAPLVSMASYTTALLADDAPAATGPGSGAAGPTFTAAQAHAGATVYSSVCSSCHGVNLQGVAAPAVAGKVFLADAASNKWTYADLRNLVTQQMPLNNPGSLTPTQYADVLAFLLASNCFPAGTTAFPETDSPVFAATKVLAPTAPVTATNATLQTCAVK